MKWNVMALTFIAAVWHDWSGTLGLDFAQLLLSKFSFSVRRIGRPRAMWCRVVVSEECLSSLAQTSKTLGFLVWLTWSSYPCLMWRKLLLLTSRQGYSSPCHTSTTLCITMFELYFVIILITFCISCIKPPCWILAQVINEIASNLNLTFTRSFFIHQFDSISIHLSILKLEAGVKILNLCSGIFHNWKYLNLLLLRLILCAICMGGGKTT